MVAEWMNKLVDKIEENVNDEEAAADREQVNYFHVFEWKQSP